MKQTRQNRREINKKALMRLNCNHKLERISWKYRIQGIKKLILTCIYCDLELDHTSDMILTHESNFEFICGICPKPTIATHVSGGDRYCTPHANEVMKHG